MLYDTLCYGCQEEITVDLPDPCPSNFITCCGKCHPDWEGAASESFAVIPAITYRGVTTKVKHIPGYNIENNKVVGYNSWYVVVRFYNREMEFGFPTFGRAMLALVELNKGLSNNQLTMEKGGDIL